MMISEKLFLFILFTFFVLVNTCLNAQQNSVLHSGDWFKIGVSEEGVYQISYNDFQTLGINVSNLDVQSIKLYGNGGGMLPSQNSTNRINDLSENAIEVIDVNGNGIFNSDDYILFFGESAHEWVFDSSLNIFNYNEHLYSDINYYFVTIDNTSNGKKILQKPTFTNYDKTITSFNDFQIHEVNSENLIQSGREWFGERFGVIDEYSFGFNFPNLNSLSPVHIKTSVAARSLNPSYFALTANNNFLTNINVANIVYDYATQYAKTGLNSNQFISNSDQIDVDIAYNYSENNAIGWLNYIQLNCRRDLKMHNGFLHFRDLESMTINELGKFVITNANSQTKVWDITDPNNVTSLSSILNNSTLTFIDSISSLKTYYAFDQNFKSPELIGKIDNQNLHSLDASVEYIIVSHSDFLNAANKLKEIHQINDNLNSVVVTPDQIYNEFSSGKPDVAAIRDFFRMLYKLPNSNFKYALLFGDGSYDNKNRINENTNFIPTFQSVNSLHPTLSYVTDDFFVLLDETDGDFVNDIIDIGIGRLPVKTLSEANNMVNKIELYYSADALGDWRNTVTFVADDGDAKDGNQFMTQANNLANYIDTNHQNININKIFLDNYLQESTPGGPRSPDAQSVINRSVDNGSFLINYIGHGGPLGWAQERIVEIDQINSWQNQNKLPLFMTATCKFAAFDDPEKVSAGEYLLLNNTGGAIALLTTTRLVFSVPNYTLNKNFINVLYEKLNGENPRLGDLYKQTKVLSGSGSNTRNFILLGDPALSLAYPKYNISTKSISDTIKALQTVTISGEVTDDGGMVLDNFNGVLTPTIFDKEIISYTLGQESCTPMPYKNQTSILYKGEVSVNSGEFSFSFVVPKDIDNNFDNGKISYYAQNSFNEDASGYDDSFVIGGVAENIIYDYDGPVISLFINNRNFIDGGISNSNPLLIVDVEDISGINTVGNGIGHDITAILDNNSSNPFILNEYYRSNLDNFRKGVVEFPFSNLSNGEHSVTFKIWDVFNNSSEKKINFLVTDDGIATISDFLNYPNPFSNGTDFYFQNNQVNQLMDINIQIYTVTGRLVKTINESFYNDGFRIGPISWDGKSSNGENLSAGLYIANLNINLENGMFETKSIRIAITP